MSQAQTDSDDTEEQSTNDAQQERQVAKRAFAAEINRSTHTFKDGEEQSSPNFVTLPTMEHANRILLAGTAVDISEPDEDSSVWKAEVNDSTGTFYVQAGQYQPEAQQSLKRIETPEYVAVVGKPRVFDPEDSDDKYVSIRPETIVTIDEATRDRWVLDTAERTLDRIELSKDLTSEDINDANLDVFELYGDDIVSDISDVVTDALERINEKYDDTS